jgi:hypothetical protein
MVTLVLLVALMGCGKGVRNRPAAFPNSAEQVSVRPGSINAGGPDVTVLPGSTVTELGPTQVATYPGESAGTTVTGFFTVDAGSGSVMATTPQSCPAATQAQSDLSFTLDEAARPWSIAISDIPRGQTLAPGVYEFTYFVEIASGDLTLDVLDEADAAMILQIGSMLTDSPGRQVILGCDSRASNLFCRVGSSAALGPSWVSRGNLPLGQSKTPETGTTLDDTTLACIAATLKTHTIGPQ